MRKSLLTVLALASLMSVAPSLVHAADRAPVVASATDNDPATLARKKVLVQRYFETIHFNQLMDNMMKSMIPPLMESMRKQNPNLTAAQSQLVSDAVIETMGDFTPKFLEQSEGIYAETFTEEELTQLVTFYESPVGQSIMAKIPNMMPRMTQLMIQDMPDLQSAIVAKMCAKIDCKATKPAA